MSIILFIVIGIGMFCYFIFGKNIEILSLIIISGISYFFGYIKYSMESDRLFKELFTEFNKKYDEKFNNLLNNIDSNKESYVLTEQDKYLIIDYFNMCAEEYLWYKKNRISKDVWLSWKSGMIYYMKLEKIQQILQEQEIQKNSYYGLFDEIKCVLSGASQKTENKEY